MWVLQPVAASDEQQTLYLTSGDISIGRPLKKGSTVGKADILIFNEQSVSSIHATLHVEAAIQQPDGDPDSFSHGSISITDVSKFGTHLTRSRSAEQKLTTKQAMQLQDGDVLRFGSKCKYRVQQVVASLVTSRTCLDQHPQLQQHAAALNIQLISAGAYQAAAAAAAAAAQHTYCVAHEDEELAPAALLALIQNQPIVTPAWAETAATARKAWPGELFSSTLGQHRPDRLGVPAAGAQQESSWLLLSEWEERSPGLLSEFLLVFEQQGDLADAAAACGAGVTTYEQHAAGTVEQSQKLGPPRPGRKPRIARFPVFVRATQWSSQQQQQQQQQQLQQQPAKGEMACVSDLQLLHAIVNQTKEELEAVREEFEDQQLPAESKETREARVWAMVDAAAAAAAAEVQEHSEGGVATEADDTEQEEDADPAAAATAAAGGSGGGGGAGTATGAGAAAAAAAAAAVPAVAVPVRNQGRTAVAADSAADGQGWHHSHAPGSSTASQRTQARTAGTKRGAAAAASDATGTAAPNSKRRRTAGAAGASPIKSPLNLQRKPRQQQQQQQQQHADLPADTGAAGDAGMQDIPQQQQQQQQGDLGCSEEVTVALVVTGPGKPPSTVAVGGGPQVPNYKAFRRRSEGQQGGQQQQQQQQQGVLAVELVAAEAPHLQGPDIDTFLRDEKHRQDRLRKADELFHANIRATKAPAVAKPAPRSKKK